MHRGVCHSESSQGYRYSRDILPTVRGRVQNVSGRQSNPKSITFPTERLAGEITMKTQKQFTNRLIHETSPYLRQHAHNPVDWYPWCAEALERAKQLDRPIFLSIGYSACHWCHVMEHESFENEEIAKILNEHFVSIKVDREERPHLFSAGRSLWPPRFQAAVVAYSRSLAHTPRRS